MPTATPTPGRVVPTPLPTPIIVPERDGCAHAPANSGNGLWAFEATFNGDPSAPSQTLLPCNFDFAATHRTHPGEVFAPLKTFPADHGPDCGGPNPLHNPLAQHQVSTSHFSGSRQPDPSFYICKNHMMSSVGHVSAYSITSFWPKQEFDFADGGILEFDVNINDSHPRTWFEVLIAPRDELKINSARSFLPIEETYPAERIVFIFQDSKRTVQVGRGALDPDGVMLDASEDYGWAQSHPGDIANVDRRIRRKMRVMMSGDQLIWSIETANGSFDSYRVDVPGGLPFTRGLVIFKTHSYTPEKEGNFNAYTFHWDNIRFSGPEVGQYNVYEASKPVSLETNGNRPIGDRQTVSIELPESPVNLGQGPVLFGQVHSAMRGQVLLSINGQPPAALHPYSYSESDCATEDWHSFRLPLDPSLLRNGDNTFTWIVGPRPGCAGSDWPWDGFSVKGLEIQFARAAGSAPPPLDSAARHALFGRVYVDTNGSASLDESEQGLSGLLVRLFSARDEQTPLMQATTDEQGQYRFENLPSGPYTVKFVVPPLLSPVQLNTVAVQVGAQDVQVPDFGFISLEQQALLPLVCAP